MDTHHARIITTNNPFDFVLEKQASTEQLVFSYDQIGIDEMRALIQEAHRRPQEGYTDKEIVVAALKITREAEQAGLKILEEPPAHIRIVLVLPKGTQLLPTILSRVQVEDLSSDNSQSVVLDWLQLGYAERIKMVEEKVKAKDMTWMQLFKTELQQYAESKKLEKSAASEVQLVLENLLTRGASNKMLIEHLALSLPLTGKA